MGQAREVMDRLTAALTTSTDLKAAMECFAEDAVAVTPDGEIKGRESIAEYWRQMTDAIPNSQYESAYKHESGNTAIDEGFFVGKNTGPLVMPSGEVLAATQKEVRVRGCDIATVEDDKIVSYRLYFDQLDFLGQLGLLGEAPT